MKCKVGTFNKQSLLSSTAEAETSRSFKILVKYQLGLAWQRAKNAYTNLTDKDDNFDKSMLQL